VAEAGRQAGMQAVRTSLSLRLPNLTKQVPGRNERAIPRETLSRGKRKQKQKRFWLLFSDI
jgi:hypothetical protein